MSRLLLPLVVLGLVLAGCGGTSADDEHSASPPSSSAPPTPTQAVPKVGQCYDLDYRAATSATRNRLP